MYKWIWKDLEALVPKKHLQAEGKEVLGLQLRKGVVAVELLRRERDDNHNVMFIMCSAIRHSWLSFGSFLAGLMERKIFDFVKQNVLAFPVVVLLQFAE